MTGLDLATLQENIRVGTFMIPLILLAFALHEMAHAYAATWFGDPTPARHGRRTLNPIRHLDPVGTIMIVASMLLFGFPFGFAVTPVNDELMRKPRLHGALTALAGPMVNIIMCGISLVLLVVAYEHYGPVMPGEDVPFLLEAADRSMTFNAFLAVFNLLPIPPLDGGRIVGSFMNRHMQAEWNKIGEYGIFIILALVLFGGGSFQQFVGQLSTWLLQFVDLFVDSPFLF
ncbi:MAG: site-2 protease family protein [Thermoleophilia bacterium]|nr:site-2 protease family protein [Thermoleophilia bacterium]MCZ4495812.1 site-2 protease family protein [Thermoleophilia bacterium]